MNSYLEKKVIKIVGGNFISKASEGLRLKRSSVGLSNGYLKNSFVDSVSDGSKLTNFLCLHIGSHDSNNSGETELYMAFVPKTSGVSQTPGKPAKAGAAAVSSEDKPSSCFVESFKLPSRDINSLLKSLEEIQEECAEFSGRQVKSKIEQQILAKRSFVWLNKFKSVFRDIQDCLELSLEEFPVSGSLTLLLDPCLAQLPFEKMFSSKLGSRPSSKKEFSHIQRDFSVDIFQSRQKYYLNQPDNLKKDSKEVAVGGKGKKGGGSTTSLKTSDTTNFIMVSDRKIPLNTKRSVIQNKTFSSKIHDSPGELTDSQLSKELKTSKNANIFYQPSGLHKKECGELNCIDFVKLAASSVSKGVTQLNVLLDGGLSSPDAVVLLGQFLGYSSFMSSLRSLDFDKNDLVISESSVNKDKSEQATEVDDVEKIG